MLDSRSAHGILPASKLLLAVIAILVLLAGIQLCIYGRETHIYFAWTIRSPLVAALIGSGYWGALVAIAVACRDLSWHHIKGAAPSTFTPTLLLLLATLLHWDRFHFSSPVLITWLAAWIWLAVYILAPVLAVWAAIVEMRRAGPAPPARTLLPTWLRAAAVPLAAIAGLTGIALWIVPDAMVSLWPTPLTPLLARALGSIVLSVAVGLVMVGCAADFERARVPLYGLLAVSALQAISIARFSSEILWQRPSAYLYCGFLALIMLGAAGALIAGRRSAISSAPRSS